MTTQIDAHFPGGNIVVDLIEGNHVYVHQDIRDTAGWWFYWCFRVRQAAGRELTFHFTDGDVVGVRGPAASRDNRGTWTWLGRGPETEPVFRFRFEPDDDEVYFGFCMSYTETHLAGFLRDHTDSPFLEATSLCRSRKGRNVEVLRAGRLDGQCSQRILLTCRHHCCETMASFALEGILDTVVGDTDDGAWFRGNVEVLAIPFVDKDGVEDGDQGKNRRPHDHNRDYAGKSVYPEVAAIRERVPQWLEGKPAIALDMHCPWIRGGRNEVIHFVGQDALENWKQLTTFSRILEAVATGPLPYRAADNLPFGESWNTSKNFQNGKSSARWARELPGVRLATSVELPYANASGAPVTADSARAFGRDLARAVHRFLDA